jgi:salicylate 5-hydroxylase small subunit
LVDRVYSVTQTLFHEPYYQRHIVSGFIVKPDGDAFCVRANYLVVRTKAAALPEVYSVGRYVDRIVEHDGSLRFAEKLCIFDSELIANSMIYPI